MILTIYYSYSSHTKTNHICVITKHQGTIMSKSQTILIVDDDPIITMQVEELLKQNNFRVISASNGGDGIISAEHNIPDLILLDRRMPEMDGNATLIRLKNTETTKNIPVIMLTGDQRATDIATSFELGAIDYIVKPFDNDLTIKRIKKALNSSNED